MVYVKVKCIRKVLIRKENSPLLSVKPGSSVLSNAG